MILSQICLTIFILLWLLLAVWQRWRDEKFIQTLLATVNFTLRDIAFLTHQINHVTTTHSTQEFREKRQKLSCCSSSHHQRADQGISIAVMRQNRALPCVVFCVWL